VSSYFALIADRFLSAVKSNIASDHNAHDPLFCVLAFMGILWILLINAMVKMYFGGAAFDNDIAPVWHFGFSLRG